MYYTVYQITNLINGKVYIGAHKTDDLEDGYMGSGKHLNRAIKKYGIDNFKKEILSLHNSSAEMYDTEQRLVNESFVRRLDTYNLKRGGEGGPVIMKNTEYYLSGKQIDNMTRARNIASENRRLERKQRICDYNLTPVFCDYCREPVVYEKRHNTFCNRICAALFNSHGHRKPWYHDPVTLASGKFISGSEPLGWERGRIPRIRTKTCVVCTVVFQTNINTNTCSGKCKYKRKQIGQRSSVRT